jgi:virginiamycin B lyase
MTRALNSWRSIAAGLATVLSLAVNAPTAIAANTITEFPVPTINSSPAAITAGRDGGLWFTELAVGKIGRITSGASNTIAEFPLPISPTLSTFGLTSGPDGNLWLTQGDKIGRLSPSAPDAITVFQLPGSFSESITSGPDGSLWFTERNNQIGRITSSTPNTISEISPAPRELTGRHHCRAEWQCLVHRGAGQ